MQKATASHGEGGEHELLKKKSPAKKSAVARQVIDRQLQLCAVRSDGKGGATERALPCRLLPEAQCDLVAMLGSLIG
ncbi:hypothetical protein ACGF0K_36175 [Streptomyces sp. NPDC048156]|uniref:hypothetical protein n=1 Tax=Streptomyces sp. NPDC048156 TaxID=3365502 RepID=UPI003717D84B